MLNSLQRPIVAVLNHLTAPESWATGRLRHHAGQHIRIEAGPMALHLSITHDGLFSEGSPEQEADVCITLGHDFPLRFLVDRANAFSAARIAGSAEFAETLGFVLRNLQWDAEADLARLVGDIAARRLVMAGQGILGWQQQALRRLADNLAEYARDEARLVVSKDELASWRQATHTLRDDVERLEKRLRLLEK